MNKKNNFSVVTFVFLLIFAWFLSDTSNEKNQTSESVKVALRSVGHQLLLAQKDSTSLVLPIVKIADGTYRLEFQNDVSFEPGVLVAFIEKTFKKAAISTNYVVEVIQCTDKEVAYSYQMKHTVEKSIVPCGTRSLPLNCYQIVVKFTSETSFSTGYKAVLFLLIFLVFIFIQFGFYKKKEVILSEKTTEKHTTIGSFQFYATQNKLVKEAVEISLSKKECELLIIFAANPNQIIKREELTKKVWEDNGVFVGRSLDTYISKLRKKLKDDVNIQLVNVHGVGYKLEV